MDLTPLATAQQEAINRLDSMAPPSASNPHRYHEEKSEILFSLRQVHMMMTGNWRVPSPPKPEKPAKKAIQPGPRAIKGRVVHVDFRAKRRLDPAL